MRRARAYATVAPGSVRAYAPTRRARAYATVAPGSVGAYARVGAYGSLKKLPSGVPVQNERMN
jgi:hypothetical protein